MFNVLYGVQDKQQAQKAMKPFSLECFVKGRHFMTCGFMGEQNFRLPPINIIFVILQPFFTITSTNYPEGHHKFFG